MGSLTRLAGVPVAIALAVVAAMTTDVGMADVAAGTHEKPGWALAYTHTPDGGSTWKLLVAGPSRTTPRVIRDLGGENVMEVVLSPDGRRVAYATDKALFVVDVATRRRHRVASGWIENPAWAHSGQRIAFETCREGRYLECGGPSTIEVVGADGRGRRMIATLEGRERGRPRWSPDDRRLLASDRSGLVAMPATGGRPSLVVPNAVSGSWSSDGKAIAYLTNCVATGKGGEWVFCDIAVAALDGSKPRILVRRSRPARFGPTEAPTWIPGTSSFVTSVYSTSTSDKGAAARLFVVDSRTGAKRALDERPWENLAVSRDGRYVAGTRVVGLQRWDVRVRQARGPLVGTYPLRDEGGESLWVG